jgi:DNA modification methylase
MPTLNWIGKEAVVNHHQQVPFHLLKEVPELACGDSGQGNLIVQGDNLVALKALLPYYAGQVKCIYIDPPYNTGNEGWAYNDNVNSPLIRAWLGKVVGKEGETLDRHDRWLCMMYPRLALLRQFLRQDGMIFVSIGDDEIAAMLFILDEIFGASNRTAIFSWKSRAKPVNIGEAKVRPQQVSEYICVYALSASAVKFHAISSGEARTYPHAHESGRRYRLQTILKSNRGENVRETMRFEIAGYQPKSDQRWQGGQKFIQDLYDFGHLEFKDGTPFRRYFEDEEPDENDPLYAFLPPEWTGTAESGKEELNRVLGNQHGFDTVKPTLLIKRLLAAVTRDNDIILDSFGGSGTTAHAVLSLNKQDGANRRFVIIEMLENISRNITTERIKRAVTGYTTPKGERIAALGGGFRYCELGEPLFDEHGKIRDSVCFSDLARHVFFTETGEPLPQPKAPHSFSEDEGIFTSPLLGKSRGAGIYLLYNGILGDKNAQGGNVLTRAVLAQLPPFDGPKVIYCAGCLLGPDRLRAENILIRQTPYEIKIS